MARSWTFFRAGGVNQVAITKGAELASLRELDQKLWVALSCPVKGTALDSRGLALLDSDHDGRVRAPELIEAGEWAAARLRDVEELVSGRDALPLDAITTATDEGRVLVETARGLLKAIGKADATSISLEDVRAGRSAFDKEHENGDGVVPPQAVADEAERQMVVDIVSVTPEPKVDRCGEAGVDRAALTAFFAAAEARLAWSERGNAEELRPLGDASADAFAALKAVEAKVDDFFTRVRVAGFDGRATAALNRDAETYATVAAEVLSASGAELSSWPLAHIEAEASLPLGVGVNPAFHGAMRALREKVIVPLLGERDKLTEEEWARVKDAFAAHRAWHDEEPGRELASLSPERLRELLKPEVKERLDALIAADETAAPRAAAIDDLEKLVWLHGNLLTLANNFVSFRDFYSRRTLATFQAGTLYLDQRAFELCLEVFDPVKHAAMSAASRAYLLYCDIRSAKGETRSIVAAVTEGDVDNLMVGRNGVFYDRDGLDWDATVTKIVDNPISIRQAFWSPYKKAIRFVEEQISKRAAEAAAEAEGKVTNAAASVTEASADKPPPPPAAPKKIDVGVVAALGVAVGGITASLGMLLEAFFGLGFLMPLGVLGLMLAISGPSMAVAALKLRQRNLGPLLDANGWAVNTLPRINIPLGRSLTSVAALPEGATRTLRDPFEEAKQPWWAYATALILLALCVSWAVGALDRFLPEGAKSTVVFGSASEAPEAPPAEEAAPPAE